MSRVSYLQPGAGLRTFCGHLITGSDRPRLSGQPILHHALTDPKNFIRVGLLEEWWKRGISIFGPEPPVSTGLLEADLGRSPREKDLSKLDTAARALQQCWSAAQGLSLEKTLELFDQVHRIVVPVLVTGAQLWSCRLSPDGDEVELVATDYARVRAPSPDRPVLIHVMGSDRFQEFTQQVADLQAGRAGVVESAANSSPGRQGLGIRSGVPSR